jgi:Fe-S-cluster containining protein
MITCAGSERPEKGTVPWRREGQSPFSGMPAKGLPGDLGGRELDARRVERLQTVQILKSGRTPLKIVEIADRATALAEEAVEGAKRAYPPPSLACKEGCDWCCYLRVGTAVPEVFRIAFYLRQTLSPEELRSARERIVKLDEQRRQLRASKRAEARLPCALLVDRRCSAYPVRPLTCRGFNSSDAHQCELFLKLGNKVTVPTYNAQFRLTTFVLDGMRAGVSEAGLKGDLLDLTSALRIAFEVPDAFERWLAGEPVFAPARLD